MRKVTVITGAAGQDGRILAKRLHASGVVVIGVVKNKMQYESLNNYLPGLEIQDLDLFNQEACLEFFAKNKPEVLYNFASHSSVAESWKNPVSSYESNIIPSLNILESIRTKSKDTYVLTPISGDIFGNSSPHIAHNEKSKFQPLSPYGISKTSIFYLHEMYQKNFGLSLSTPILFNHESPLRTEKFLSKKIAQGIAHILQGQAKSISIENSNVARDWGWAPDYVAGMQLMSQKRSTDLFIVASGVPHSVSDFLQIAFNVAGINNWERYITPSSEITRPADIYLSFGSAEKISTDLAWKPTQSFENMIEKLVKWELNYLSSKEDLYWYE